jgi:hypothetical protein
MTRAYLDGYLYKKADSEELLEASKKLNSPSPIPGFNPSDNSFNMVDHLRTTYGKETGRELDKADAYAIKNKLPIRMGRDYREPAKIYPVNMVPFSRGYIDKGITGPRAYPDKGVIGLELESPITSSTNSPSLDTANGYIYNTSYKSPLAGRHQAIRHEMAHLAAGKDHRASREALGKRLFTQIPYSASRFDPTYPEFNAAETIPPLAALQQHLFKTTGKRIESPEEYDTFVKRVDNLPEKDRLAYIKKLPVEVQRLFGYRDVMRRPLVPSNRPNKTLGEHMDSIKFHQMSHEDKLLELERRRLLRQMRLKQYDNFNREMIPGIVQNLINRPGQKYHRTEG